MQSGGILLESRSKKYLCSQSTVCFIMSVTLPLGFFTSTGMLQDTKRLLAQKWTQQRTTVLYITEKEKCFYFWRVKQKKRDNEKHGFPNLCYCKHQSLHQYETNRPQVQFKVTACRHWRQSKSVNTFVTASKLQVTKWWWQKACIYPSMLWNHAPHSLQ